MLVRVNLGLRLLKIGSRIKSFQDGSMENGSWYEEQVVQAHASMICKGVQSQGNIEASSVLENAIIEKDVTIRDCLIGKGAHIKEGANLTNVIVDHGAIVPKNHTQHGGRILNAQNSITTNCSKEYGRTLDCCEFQNLCDRNGNTSRKSCFR